MEPFTLGDAIDRIRQMEALFDTLAAMFAANPDTAYRDPRFQQWLTQLTEYYDGGQWLQDYLLDEQGLLPRDLKRGILAEDTVYNFLSDIKNSRSN